MEFQYDCVNPNDIEELAFLMDNSTEIDRAAFIEAVGEESYLELEKALGYQIDGFRMEDDWHVAYFKSMTLSGRQAVYVVHSAIEYVYY